MKTNRKTIPMPMRYLINTVLIVLFILASTLFVNSDAVSGYFTKILMVIGINIILAVSLNIATGYLGQLPLGHAGFMAVGAYTGGIFLKAVDAAKATGGTYYLYVAAALVLSGIVAGIFGILIGVPALRLKGDYLAIITLGFGEIIRVVLTNIDSVLGFDLTYGASGLKRIPKITTFFNVLLCVVLSCVVIHMVMKSRHGRAILSIRENEIAAESCGIRTTYYKVMAFTMSAFFAGVAGCLYAGYLGSLQPSSFGFMKSIEILVMVVLGGMGSMLGSILSATVLTALPEALRAFSDYRMVVYSLVLVLMMIFKPTGLLGQYDFSLSRILEKLMNPKKSAGKKEGASHE
ncbi:MAG: branched-chain amino acid transport system permease protein [Clostridiales bacterium]|jgi:branched-chain amino acid transport system permease protein|nr:branched-chain amino acid ABC transporter permease [Pygmaiobacter sp.]MDK2813655.1 branched-chain amino acid transport system permease protein [Clostridiales bacterium]